LRFSRLIRGIDPGEANHSGPDPPAFEVGILEDLHEPSVDGDPEVTRIENHLMAGMPG
jgi:hypothetical protein